MQQLPLHASTADRRPKTSGDSRTPFFKRRTHLDDVKRDSGLAPSFVSSRKGSNLDIAPDTSTQAVGSMQDAIGIPFITLNDTVGDAAQDQEARRPHTSPGPSPTPRQETHADGDAIRAPFSPIQFDSFSPLSTSIETGAFDDPFGEDHLSFSKRGSVLLDGFKANSTSGMSRAGSVLSKKSPIMSTSKSPSLGLPQRSPSVLERRLSQKVRSMYEGVAMDEDGERGLGIVAESPVTENNEEHQREIRQTPDDATDTITELPRITSPSHSDLSVPSGHLTVRGGNKRSSYIRMEPWEAAGGLEDWRDVNSRDVDRYGFVRPSTSKSRTSSMVSSHAPSTPDRSGHASVQFESPENGPLRKSRRPPPNSLRSNRLSVTGQSTLSLSRSPSHAASATSTRSRRSNNPFRRSSSHARRWADEAPDMLSAEPGMPISPHGPSPSSSAAKSKTEQRRVDKWEKMARPVNPSRKPGRPAVGGGQSYMFDTRSPKLVERVWKGIPDVWRAPAWHAFLMASSRDLHKEGFVADDELVRRYRAHQQEDCLDDVQIDMDVPRTVGEHILFRARYRGGQRLLFRVLRALSLEHPVTGYVQGMAPLAATLLCYFDEERAFACACRLWSDRGLAELFAPGFGELMKQLGVFEEKWLAENKKVKGTLEELGIPPTSYGTKWYLTLFNYALPFEAQLRVWDVFMLLGGPANTASRGRGSRETKGGSGKNDDGGGRFDVLHAVSAALIDALQETLVGAEFENAMKALTGHVAVREPDVLMRVARREFEERERRRRKGR